MSVVALELKFNVWLITDFFYKPYRDMEGVIGILQQHIFCLFEPVVCNFRLLNDAYCEVRVK